MSELIGQGGIDGDAGAAGGGGGLVGDEGATGADGGGGGAVGGGAVRGGDVPERTHLVDVRTFGEMFKPSVTSQTVRNWIRMQGMPYAKIVKRGSFTTYRVDPTKAMEWVVLNRPSVLDGSTGHGGAREGAGRRMPGRPRGQRPRVDGGVPPIFAAAAADAGGERASARSAIPFSGGPSAAWRGTRSVRDGFGVGGGGGGGGDDGGAGDGGGGVVSVNPVNAARIAQLEVETALKRVELRVKEAELLEREEVVRVWSKLLQTLAERLGGVASACSGDLLSLFGAVDGALRSRVEEIIGREVERARAVVAEEPFGGEGIEG